MIASKYCNNNNINNNNNNNSGSMKFFCMTVCRSPIALTDDRIHFVLLAFFNSLGNISTDSKNNNNTNNNNMTLYKMS